MSKNVKNTLFSVGDFLYEVWESLIALFINYKKKKDELEGHILKLLSSILSFRNASKWEDREYGKTYQLEIHSDIWLEVGIIESWLLRGYTHTEELGGMLYKYFIDKFDIDKLSKTAFNEESPISKDHILDKNLLEEYIDKYKLW